MHTVITAFGSKDAAQSAMDRLSQSGISRGDMHIEHRDAQGHAQAEGLTAGQWEGMEREVAVSPEVLRNFGAFFASLFGADDTGRVDAYAKHVERGSYVLVVDTNEPLDAQRCNALMRELGGTDNHLADRSTGTHRPLRDIVADRQVTMTGMTSK